MSDLSCEICGKDAKVGYCIDCDEETIELCAEYRKKIKNLEEILEKIKEALPDYEYYDQDNRETLDFIRILLEGTLETKKESEYSEPENLDTKVNVECTSCGNWLFTIPHGFETVANWQLSHICPKCGHLAETVYFSTEKEREINIRYD